MGLPRILAGGPARETTSLVYQLHRQGLKAQSFGFELDIRHEIVSDPGGVRWQHDKIARVAQMRQWFMDEAYIRPDILIIGHDHSALLMVDTDVILGPGVLERMWAVDADVVYGVYWTYSDWGGPMADYPQVWNINPYGWTPECAEQLHAPGVNEVEVYGGGAVTLIRGRGFESRYWPLLQSLQPYQSMFAGEDRTYALGLECRGIRQVAVTGLPIHHCYGIQDQTKPALERIAKKVGLVEAAT
jgi:hypothetical protein